MGWLKYKKNSLLNPNSNIFFRFFSLKDQNTNTSSPGLIIGDFGTFENKIFPKNSGCGAFIQNLREKVMNRLVYKEKPSETDEEYKDG